MIPLSEAERRIAIGPSLFVFRPYRIQIQGENWAPALAGEMI